MAAKKELIEDVKEREGGMFSRFPGPPSAPQKTLVEAHGRSESGVPQNLSQRVLRDGRNLSLNPVENAFDIVGSEAGRLKGAPPSGQQLFERGGR
jgi:hypothetical protein